MVTVYRFTIVWDDGDSAFRYVAATTEDEAIEKLEKYRDYVVAHENVMHFTVIPYGIVDTANVIY